MKRLHRMILAGAAGILAVTSVGTAHGVVAYEEGGTYTLSLPGETERVRLDAARRTFQISHDGGRTWSRTLPQATQMHLRSRSFDPLKTDHGSKPTGGTAHIVQFIGAPLDSQRRDLLRLGVRLDAYLPDYAYVAQMSAETSKMIKALPYLRWVGEYEPADRLPTGVGPGRVMITLVRRDVTEQRAVIDRIEAAGGSVQAAAAACSKPHWTAHSSARSRPSPRCWPSMPGQHLRPIWTTPVSMAERI